MKSVNKQDTNRICSRFHQTMKILCCLGQVRVGGFVIREEEQPDINGIGSDCIPDPHVVLLNNMPIKAVLNEREAFQELFFTNVKRIRIFTQPRGRG
jgi:hypothetical protein